MTETGMVLSNPVEGARKPGFVGKPMPGVQVNIRLCFLPLVMRNMQVKVVPCDKGDELLVKGKGVFSAYLGDEAETTASFDDEGYFKTGDIVKQDADGDYGIVGRAKADILKTAGYKVSCLEIEREILGHPGAFAYSVMKPSQLFHRRC